MFSEPVVFLTESVSAKGTTRGQDVTNWETVTDHYIINTSQRVDKHFKMYYLTSLQTDSLLFSLGLRKKCVFSLERPRI